MNYLVGKVVISSKIMVVDNFRAKSSIIVRFVVHINDDFLQNLNSTKEFG